MPRYFKKHNGNVKLWMSNGHSLKFQQIGTFGYISSSDSQINEDPKLLAEIDEGIRNQVGGVVEISATQWENEFVKKKALSPLSPELRRPYREEIGSGIARDTLAPKVAAAEPKVESFQPVSEPVTVQPGRSLRERANLGHR